MSENPAKQARLKDRHQAELNRHRQRIAQARPRGELNRGWDYELSGGIPVWQLVPGGEYREFVGHHKEQWDKIKEGIGAF